MDRAHKTAYGFLSVCTAGLLAIWVGYRIDAAAGPDLEAASQAPSAQAIEAPPASTRTTPERAETQIAGSREDQELEIAFTFASQGLTSLKRRLRDPGSAEFRDVWAVRGTISADTSYFACGYENSRNAYGTHTGFSPFVAIGSAVMTAGEPGFEQFYEPACLEGHRLMKLNP